MAKPHETVTDADPLRVRQIAIKGDLLASIAWTLANGDLGDMSASYAERLGVTDSQYRVVLDELADELWRRAERCGVQPS